MPASFRQIIDKAVKDKRFLVVPGAHDALSARIIQKLGFETYFIGGFPAVGARYGVPDVGLKGFGEIAACVRDIMAACDLPVFVDGDDGYGDVKNVVHTVQSYERMGVSAILIEDQQWPKRCGHMVGKKVVPIGAGRGENQAACSERINPETWILARTDARAVYDLDEAMRRAERYIRAGADGIFIEAPRSVEELKRIGKAFDVPQICNPLMGGHTPILTHGGAGRARLQLRGARPRHRDARRQSDRDGAARHEVRQVRAAQRRHGFRGLQEGRRLRQMGERRRAVRAARLERGPSVGGDAMKAYLAAILLGPRRRNPPSAATPRAGAPHPRGRAAVLRGGAHAEDRPKVEVLARLSTMRCACDLRLRNRRGARYSDRGQSAPSACRR